MWDDRYGMEAYAYGTEPNTFLSGIFPDQFAGKILCLGEGEGRNAVWLAQQGHDVTAVDLSEVGLQKARNLARSKGVSINTIHANLADYDIGYQTWDAIVSIFCHLPPQLRKDVHRRAVAGLRTGGVFVLEAYTPDQLNYKTGGPPSADMMMDAALLQYELDGLDFVHLKECIRDIQEGEFHNGRGAVVQVFARKS